MHLSGPGHARCIGLLIDIITPVLTLLEGPDQHEVLAELPFDLFAAVQGLLLHPASGTEALIPGAPDDQHPIIPIKAVDPASDQHGAVLPGLGRRARYKGGDGQQTTQDVDAGAGDVPEAPGDKPPIRH